ncbi:tRNA pseudouridine(38-40) synthase TruA [Chitinophagaceae bacterium LB-8]|jgi:tRNA pseudouridine38-40 synthase|uniref:tRNA pseudouridine synthase A n=1 Tax=Paraflavisolibacter caeni TaxID=2982496 RepID=A0A9X2Y108_9BACT|nr:tRNA pseudouridine(38-40) synthase TruA [Paraflavisolibacter caeni]MCU7552715.1 tRNA pseudouridine(38-40) synthase TruA [Paraflavisolibacter caeni]
MPRFFLEVAYKGTQYSGFQIQENSNTIQAEVEKTFKILLRQSVDLTGSSRTDAGVHALQNYFHFDFSESLSDRIVYKMNAILPDDIVVKGLYTMPENAHSRFDATSREYDYVLYQHKNPFLKGIAYYFPYTLDEKLLHEAAALVKSGTNFFAFSKTNTQVKNFNCKIYKSQWIHDHDKLIYNIEGNRFLRGMVRLLTASMLKVGRGKISLDEFASMFTYPDQKCGFSVPPDGLFLKRVKFPNSIIED